MSVVDLSGYSCSGKSIVYDLLTCSKSFYGFGVNFHFELSRAPGGIIDLREAISGENWSPIRSSEAIRRYFRLIENLGGNIKSTVSKETNILIIKNSDSTSSKIKKAKELDINIINIENFKNKYLK